MRMAVASCMLLGMLALDTSCATGRPERPRMEFPWPPSDRAYIYVYRTGLYPGPMKLWLDGVLVGGLPHDTFAFLQVRPGRHVLVTESFDGAELPVHVIGGEVVFLEQDVTVVPYGSMLTSEERVRCGSLGSELQRVSRAEGRAAVQERRLIPDRPPPLPPASDADLSPELHLTGGPKRAPAPP